MIVKNGQLLKIDHSRKGVFTAIALRDFESREETWLPVAVAEGCVEGINTAWALSERIPCRASLVMSIEPVEVEEGQCNPEA